MIIYTVHLKLDNKSNFTRNKYFFSYFRCIIILQLRLNILNFSHFNCLLSHFPIKVVLCLLTNISSNFVSLPSLARAQCCSNPFLHCIEHIFIFTLVFWEYLLAKAGDWRPVSCQWDWLFECCKYSRLS